MLSIDVTNALAKTITPSFGIRDQDRTAKRGTMKRIVEKWLGEREVGEHGWANSPYNRTVRTLTASAAGRALGNNIETVVWVGIGGSGLGPRVIQEIFETPKTVEFLVLDTIDPSILEMELPLLNWSRTLVVIASKSGETLESMGVFFLLWEKLRGIHKEKAHEYVIAVTDPKEGPLHRFARTQNIPILPIPPEVGGRFSIFTPVGLLPLALLKRDVGRFIAGAKRMDSLCQIPSLDENPAAGLAAIQYLLDTKKGCPIRVVMPYIQRLQNIARWDQQLIAESLGKTETTNPFPLAAIGTPDQHSLLQQWMEGPRMAWHLFIKEQKHQPLSVPDNVPDEFAYMRGKPFGTLLDACYAGTVGALTINKRPNVTITIPTLDEESLGALFFLFMTEVVFLGSLYRINPYGQPGVELGKKITKDILSQHTL